MTADAPYERTTRSPATNHPPCDQHCWVRIHNGYLFTVRSRERCQWDDEAKTWTRCDRSTDR